MKVLLVEPLQHPQVVEIPDTLDAMYSILQCQTITVTYPWAEPVVLVTDDEGMFTNKLPSRYVRELDQPIMGNFFLCGISGENFADLPEELLRTFQKRFWPVEIFIGNSIITLEDDTEPEIHEGIQGED